MSQAESSAAQSNDRPVRALSADDLRHPHPVYVVWELTLQCDLSCKHCGSRAGKARPNELSTNECLDVVAQLARLGAREVAIIGGEAYLRADWLSIIRAIDRAGMRCVMTTGGRSLSEERIRAAADAGLKGFSVSIDGLEDVHDRLRGVAGSFKAALGAMRTGAQLGIEVFANTQINRLSMPQLREIMNVIIEHGARCWQVQLTNPMGRAADHPDLLLQPYMLLALYPLLAELYLEGLERGLQMVPGNDIGYFGPYEHLWRGGRSGEGHWIGCNAGHNTLGIEADGTIKGCPSLPTADYAGGNIRDLTLESIWNNSPQLRVVRERDRDWLWGFCRSCEYAEACYGGCTWLAHVLFGKPGNNPYCHHRALQMAERGLRERVIQIAAAEGQPFDYGRFVLVEEPLDAPLAEPEVDLTRRGGASSPLPIVSLDAPQRQSSSSTGAPQSDRAKKERSPTVPRLPSFERPIPQYQFCWRCHHHNAARSDTCSYCGANVADERKRRGDRLLAAESLVVDLHALLGPDKRLPQG